MKPLLVGEMNPYGADPFYALYPLPEGASGHRLQGILGLSLDEYLDLFNRCNLLAAPKWSARAAREAADAMVHPKRILLGARVAAAHGLKFREDLFRSLLVCAGTSPWPTDVRLLVLPHPSGLNRIWNEPMNISAARNAVADFLTE